MPDSASTRARARWFLARTLHFNPAAAAMRNRGAEATSSAPVVVPAAAPESAAATAGNLPVDVGGHLAEQPPVGWATISTPSPRPQSTPPRNMPFLPFGSKR